MAAEISRLRNMNIPVESHSNDTNMNITVESNSNDTQVLIAQEESG